MMIKSKALRFAFLAVVLAMLAVGVFFFSVGSHAAAPSVSTTTTAHVSILRTRSGVVFGKSALTVTHGVPFDIDNRTLATQTVTYNGKPLISIKGKSTAPYTFKTTGTYVLSLASNPNARLTVTVQ